MRDAARLAVDEARRAKLKATAALIIAGGAMLTAMVAGLIAVLALLCGNKGLKFFGDKTSPLLGPAALCAALRLWWRFG
jgi:hypothetical protein